MLRWYNKIGGFMISEIEIFKAINKHEVINKYLSNLISRKQAASELSCHENHIPRLVSKFEKENHESFFHKSNGTKKNRKLVDSIPKKQ